MLNSVHISAVKEALKRAIALCATCVSGMTLHQFITSQCSFSIAPVWAEVVAVQHNGQYMLCVVMTCVCLDPFVCYFLCFCRRLSRVYLA